jgi:hypothetical protein
MRLPALGRWSRWLALAYGGTLLAWLSTEDVTVWPVTLLGCCAAILIAILSVLGKLGSRQLTVREMLLLAFLSGVAIGTASSVIVAVLMFFKNAWHAHVFPDYPPEMMLAVLARAPTWAAAGGVMGLGLGFGWLTWFGKHDE